MDEWSVEDVQEWAMEMKLSDVARAFERAKIDGRKLIAPRRRRSGKLRIGETRQMRVCAALAPLKQRGARRRRQRPTRVPGGAWGGRARRVGRQ